MESMARKDIGYVAIYPKGDWNSSASYNRLDFVRHNGKSYLASAPSVGIEPGVDVGWQSAWMLTTKDGEKGDTGNGIESITKLETVGLVDTYDIKFTDGNHTYFDVNNGNGIALISKTSTSGLDDTYTIQYTNGTSVTYTVHNGNGISSVTKTGTSGLTDTYTVAFTNGSSTTFEVTNGKGIVSIEKTGTEDLVDTYTVLFNDGSTTTFTVTNGEGVPEGGKAGDLLGKKSSSDYDTEWLSPDDVTVGNAKQLKSKVYTEDKVPYNFRTSGGSIDIGDREDDTIVGGTVAWNQQLNKAYFTGTETSSGVTFTNNNDGSFSTSGTADSPAGYAGKPIINNLSTNPDHIYLGISTPKGGSMSTYYTNWASGKNDTGNGIIFSGVSSISPRITIINETTAPTAKWWFGLFDLTLMFGSTIADYIYSLEQANAGAGVAWFRKYFPKDYYAYNPGSLESVKVSKHITRGFNQFDEENIFITNYAIGEDGTISANTNFNIQKIKVVSGLLIDLTYTQNDTANRALRVHAYNGDTWLNQITCKYSANGTYTIAFSVPSNCDNVRISYRNTNTKICLDYHWDGERTGDYEKYVEYEYPLDDTLTLNGIPMLDANNQLYYDGDVYESDGTVARRYVEVDLGTLVWAKDPATIPYFYADISAYANAGANILTAKYAHTSVAGAGTNDKAIAILSTNAQVRIRDTAYSESTAAQFKTAMNGIIAIVEAKTPTTETAVPFQNPQIVDDFGTEEYVDYAYEAGDRDVAIPVGHITRYMPNLRAKLEMAPDSPEGDGDYIVRQTNGTNFYIPYTDGGRIARLEGKVPDPPAENGSYKLTCTVVDGSRTYSWVSDD